MSNTPRRRRSLNGRGIDGPAAKTTVMIPDEVSWSCCSCEMYLQHGSRKYAMTLRILVQDSSLLLIVKKHRWTLFLLQLAAFLRRSLISIGVEYLSI